MQFYSIIFYFYFSIVSRRGQFAPSWLKNDFFSKTLLPQTRWQLYIENKNPRFFTGNQKLDVFSFSTDNRKLTIIKRKILNKTVTILDASYNMNCIWHIKSKTKLLIDKLWDCSFDHKYCHLQINNSTVNQDLEIPFTALDITWLPRRCHL